MSHAFTALFGQAEHKYLIFTFDHRYKIEKQRGFFGSADHIWIVPFDSCKMGICEDKMNPLFVTEELLEDLNDPMYSDSGVGNFFVDKYLKQDTVAELIFILTQRT